MPTETANQWSTSNQLAALWTIDKDKGYSANVNLMCPVCKKPTFDYEQFSLFDLVAWCRHCRAGISQGDGERLSKEKAAQSHSEAKP